jgi:gliding motility-associated-like protein
MVPVLPGPISEFSYFNPSPGSFENTIQFVDQSTDADSWLWIFPDSTTSTDENPIHQFIGLGTYDVMLVTFNSTGCIDTIIYSVTVKEEIAFYYPSAFSPNGDGINEYFMPMGASLNNYEMTIYNRWGEIIYTGDGLSAWDGRIRNSNSFAPEGVYVFRIDIKDEGFEKQVVTGRVTLIR